MAAHFEILTGADAGATFNVYSPDFRIGPGVEHAVRITAADWPGGALRVTRQRVGYTLASELDRPVYLAGRVLRPGQGRTLHDQAVLQPTPGLLIRVALDSGHGPTDGITRTVAPKPKVIPWVNLCLGIMLVGLATWVFAKPLWADDRNALMARANELKADLAEDPAGGDPLAIARWRSMRMLLRDAAFDDAFDRKAAAHAKYVALRDQSLSHVATTADSVDRQRLRQLLAFVVDRLRVTTPPRDEPTRLLR